MARKKRRKRRRNRWRAVLRLLGVITVLVIFCYLFVILFETKKINVTGNQYTSAEEVKEWVKSGKYSSNTLYILWKYNKEDVKQLPAVEKTKIKLKSPWEVNIQVTEKSFGGRVDVHGESVYFDKDGMACLKTADVIEGVPYIEGMEMDTDKVRLGKMLPVTDEKVFEAIHSITRLTNKAELTPDKISCDGSDLTLYFGVVRIQMGSGDFAKKLNQAAPILAKLQELYPGQAGTLHLENYENLDSYIRFVPDPPPAEGEQADETAGAAGDDTYGENVWNEGANAAYEENAWNESAADAVGDNTYGENTWDESLDAAGDISEEAVWQ